MKKWDLVIMFTQEDLSVALKCFLQAVTNFSLCRKYKKSHVFHLITITLEVNLMFTIS